MRYIPVYAAERELGLTDKIQSNSSIAYYSPISIDNAPSIDKINSLSALQRAIAENKDQIDLFYLKDIMVSVGRNLNWDIFLKDEVWAARNTPEDKPFNLGHNHKEIIGHITSQYAVDEKGNTLVEDSVIDDLPDIYHIVSCSVIYRYNRDKEYMKKINDIIEEIKADDKDNKWFVSMEALFSNYDYGLTDSSGNMAVVARNEKTAFLTKYLTAYGGDGVYKDYMVGRVLRNIVFSGKGLVKNPANPNSIIFNSVTPFKTDASFEKNFSLAENLGYVFGSDKKFVENKVMATELEILQKQLDEVKASLKNEQSAKSELEAKIRDYESKNFNVKIEELTKQLESSKAEANSFKTQVNSLEENLKKEKEQLATASANYKKVSEELDSIKKEQVKNNRVLTLADKLKLTKEDALDLAETLAELTDDKFNKYVVKHTKKEEAQPKQTEAAKADLKVLDNVTPNNDIGSATADTNAKLEETRSKIGKFYKTARGRDTEGVKQ